MVFAPSWVSRGSIFARRRGERVGARAEMPITSGRVSLAPILFALGAQAMIVTFLLWSRGEKMHMVSLLLLACGFNGMMAFNWSADPGFVLESDEPCENEETDLHHWCRVCEQWQPLRAKHCDCCGRCVRKYDHHCYWVGGCVGEMNHLRFFLLLVSAVAYFFALLQEVIRGFQLANQPTMDMAIVRNAPFILLFIGIGFTVLVLFILCVFHAVLLATNQTTWEFSSHNHITYLRSRQRNPFNRGIWLNIAFLFKRGTIDWRGVLQLSERRSDVV